MIKQLILASILALGIGCQAQKDYADKLQKEEIIKQQNEINNDRQESINELSYYRDERTNLCFAVYTRYYFGNGGGAFTITNVPCTEQVETLISK